MSGALRRRAVQDRRSDVAVYRQAIEGIDITQLVRRTAGDFGFARIRGFRANAILFDDFMDTRLGETHVPPATPAAGSASR